MFEESFHEIRRGAAGKRSGVTGTKCNQFAHIVEWYVAAPGAIQREKAIDVLWYCIKFEPVGHTAAQLFGNGH